MSLKETQICGLTADLQIQDTESSGVKFAILWDGQLRCQTSFLLHKTSNIHKVEQKVHWTLWPSSIRNSADVLAGPVSPKPSLTLPSTLDYFAANLIGNYFSVCV